jgi:hypothetical protein
LPKLHWRCRDDAPNRWALAHLGLRPGNEEPMTWPHIFMSIFLVLVFFFFIVPAIYWMVMDIYVSICEKRRAKLDDD